MHIVPEADSTPTDPQREPTCPNCASPSTASSTHADRNIITAYYVCDNAHLWSVRWIEGA